jgi:hypothetical protein
LIRSSLSSPRALFAAACGSGVGQGGLPTQIALAPQRERLRYRDRNPAEDIGVAVILVTSAQHGIIEGVRSLGLCRCRHGVEGSGTQAGAELSAYGEQPFERSAKRFVSILRVRRMDGPPCDDEHDADSQQPAHVISRV